LLLPVALRPGGLAGQRPGSATTGARPAPVARWLSCLVVRNAS